MNDSITQHLNLNFRVLEKGQRVSLETSQGAAACVTDSPQDWAVWSWLRVLHWVGIPSGETTSFLHLTSP